MYIPMSKMQKLLYGQILKKDVDAINGKVYFCICVYMCPRTSVLVLVYICVLVQPSTARYTAMRYMCPRTSTC
jgi:hypothetical protein